MSSDHNKINLDISNRKISGKFPNIWKINSIILNDPRVKKEDTRETYNITPFLSVQVQPEKQD